MRQAPKGKSPGHDDWEARWACLLSAQLCHATTLAHVHCMVQVDKKAVAKLAQLVDNYEAENLALSARFLAS